MRTGALLCAAGLLLSLGGCGKYHKNNKKDEKKTAMYEADYEMADDLTLAEMEEELAAFEDEMADEEFEVADADDEFDFEEEYEEFGPEQFVFNTLRFDLNKENMTDGQEEALEEDLEMAREAAESGKKVVLQGHGCQMGPAGFNLALSVKRAEQVKNIMVERGIPADMIEVVGLGSEMPLVWSESEDRQALIQDLAPNRRVEVSLTDA